MDFESLKNPELQEMLKNASSPEELLAFARGEGYELTGEQIEQIAGGSADWIEAGFYACPECGHKIATKPGCVKCPECGHEFQLD